MTTPYPIKAPKKLIEVALPLDAINEASAEEKQIKVGKPTNIHLWWARRPLAAARAVIFGQLVNDPSWRWDLEHPGQPVPGHLKGGHANARRHLFKILEDLVLWDNTINEAVLEKARAEIKKSWREACEVNAAHPQAAELFNPDRMPGLHDPFAGGGAIPLEAQRLGLEAFASDLNPVAVLINKAMIEIPPRFAGRAPVGPSIDEPNKGKKLALKTGWEGATGLAEDIHRYGAWIRGEAVKRIGHLYPPVEVTAEMTKGRPDLKPYLGQKLTVLAWLWARTVRSPNPAFRHAEVPLVSTFVLSSKEGKDVWLEPVVSGDSYVFDVRVGKPPKAAAEGTKAAGRGSDFECLLSRTPISGDYIKAEGKAGRMGFRLMAVVAEGARSRVYLAPTRDAQAIADSATPKWKPDVEFFPDALGFRIGNYGIKSWADLFTPRQLVAITTFSDLVSEVREKVRQDTATAGWTDDGIGLEQGGRGATAYADCIATYVSLAVSRLADWSNNLTRWLPGLGKTQQMFSRPTISMGWDFSELNPLSTTGGGFDAGLVNMLRAFDRLPVNVGSPLEASAQQLDAKTQSQSTGQFISTDPPYYDNIGYADLSDFFYVWLRRSLRGVYPSLFAGITVPKGDELVATPARHGSREKAEVFFLNGMVEAMRNLAFQAHPAAPITLYYAFKQSETDDSSGTTSTGWETFLQAVLRAGLVLTGTWPMRTEKSSRMRGNSSNALASSIVLVCRPRASDAPTTSRRSFLRELNQVLPQALDEMTRGVDDGASPVAPVDLSQAIIGPGMAVFSKYAAVLEADGAPMTVRTALQLINRFLAEDDFDADTQFCLHWFSQQGWKDGKFGDADTLARAKGTSVEGVKQAGVLHAGGGIVRLLKWADYPVDWDPETDPRLPVWEVLHHLIRVFKTDGESGAAAVFAAVQAKAEPARQLAYRLYTLCERAGWAEDARAYNELITSWSAIESAVVAKATTPRQTVMFEA